MSPRLSPTRLALLSISLGASTLLADPSAQVERARISDSLTAAPAPGGSGNNAIASEPLESAPPTPGDDDLGDQRILKRQTKPTPFTAYANLSYNFTQNVALQKDGATSDSFLLASAGAIWSKPIATNLVFDIGVNQQFFRYDKTTALDFDSFNISSGVAYLVPKLDNIVLLARYNYGRLTTEGTEREFYTAHRGSVGAEKTFVLSRAHSISLTYISDFSLNTYPSSQRENTHSLSAGYNVDFTRSISGQAACKLSLVDYGNIDRLDVNTLVSLGASYKLAPWASVGVCGSYIHNSSDKSRFGYDALDASVAISVAAKF